MGLSSDTLIPYQEIANLKGINDRGRDRSFFPFQEFIHIHFSGLKGPLLLKNHATSNLPASHFGGVPRSPQLGSKLASICFLEFQVVPLRKNVLGIILIKKQIMVTCRRIILLVIEDDNGSQNASQHSEQ